MIESFMEPRIQSEYDIDLKSIVTDYTSAIADLRTYGTNMMKYEFDNAMDNLRKDKDNRIQALTPKTPHRLLQFLDQEKEP